MAKVKPTREKAKTARSRRNTATGRSTTKQKRRPAKKGQRETKFGLLARLLPQAVMRNEYIKRTIEILDDTDRRSARLQKERAKKLGQVIADLGNDVTSRVESVEESAQERIEEITEKARSTSVAQRIEEIPDRVMSTVDSWLERFGLVRKAKGNGKKKRRPATRRSAARA